MQKNVTGFYINSEDNVTESSSLIMKKLYCVDALTEQSPLSMIL